MLYGLFENLLLLNKQTLLSSENEIELNIWLYFLFEIGFRRLPSVFSFLVLLIFS